MVKIMENNELDKQTQQAHDKVLKAKEDYYNINLKNKKIVRLLKMLVYTVTFIMLILGAVTFIVQFCLDKNYFFTSKVSIPLITILFGGDAIILTQINKRMSKTNSLKGDVIELVIGCCLVLLGIIWLITNII